MARISTNGGLFFFFLEGVGLGVCRRLAPRRPPAPASAPDRKPPSPPPHTQRDLVRGKGGKSGRRKTSSSHPEPGSSRRSPTARLQAAPLTHRPSSPPAGADRIENAGEKCGAALAPALRRAAGRRQSARALGGRRASVFVQRGLLLPRHRRSECEGRAAGREPRAGRAPRDAHAATAGRRCASERCSALLLGPAAVVAALGAAREGGRPGGRVGAWV